MKHPFSTIFVAVIFAAFLSTVAMADLTDGPVWDQAQAALAAMRDLHGVDPVNGDELPGNANT